MAANTVDYIIRLLPDTSEIKNKIKAGDLLNTSDISDIKNLIIDEVKKATAAINKEAPHMQKAIQNGLSVDTSELEKRIAFIAGLMEDLEKTKNPMEDWAKRGKGVYDTFTNLQNTVGALSATVTGLQDSMNTLTSSFETFKNSYQSFRPTEFTNVNKTAKDTASVILELDKIFTDLGKDTSGIDKSSASLTEFKKILESVTGKKYEFDLGLDDLSSKEKLEELDIYVNQTIDNIGDLRAQITATQKLLEKKPNDQWLKDQIKQDKTLLARQNLMLIDAENERLKLGGKPLLGVAGEESSKQLQGEVRRLLKEFESEIKVVTNKLSTIQLDLSLPEYQSFIPKINQFVDELNTKSDTFHKVKLTTDIIDETMNPIEDKTKRAYNSKNGEKPASEDAVTDTLVAKTESRFDRLENVISKKQKSILTKTKEWRDDVVKALTIDSENLTFTYQWKESKTVGAEALFNAVQDYFDSRQIQVQIDRENFVNQIKSAVESNDLTLNVGGGNTGSVDASAILHALQQLLSSGGIRVSGGQQTTTSDTTKTNEQVSDDVAKTKTDELDKQTKAIELERANAEAAVARAIKERLEAENAAKQAVIDRANAESQLERAIKDKAAAEADIQRFDAERKKALEGWDETRYGKSQVASDALQMKSQAEATLRTASVYIENANIEEYRATEQNAQDILKEKQEAEKQAREKLYAMAAKEDKGIVSKLSESTTHIDDVVEALKKFADKAYKVVETKLEDGTTKTDRVYASKAAQSAVETLSRKGINIDDIKNGNIAKDQLIKMLQDVLMKRDETNQAQGRVLGDTLKSIVLDHNSSTTSGVGGAIYNLGKEIENLFSLQDKKTETVVEDMINKMRMDLWNKVAPYGKATGLLNKVRHARWDKNGNATGYFDPSKIKIEDIVNTIAQVESVGGDTTALNKYLDARVQLGDSKDEAAMAQFKQAAFEFYNESKELYKYLSAKFWDFKGDVYVEGRKKPIPINSPRNVASLNGVVTKVVPYSAGGQDYRVDPQTYAKRPDPEPDVKYQEIEVKKFQPKKSEAIPLGSSVKSLRKTTKEIPKLKNEIQQYQTEIDKLSNSIQQLEANIASMTAEVANVDLGKYKRLNDSSSVLGNVISDAQSALASNAGIELSTGGLKEDETSIVKRLNEVFASLHKTSVDLEKTDKEINQIVHAQSLGKGELEKLRSKSKDNIGGATALKGLQGLRGATLPDANWINSVLKSFTDAGLDTSELDKLQRAASKYNAMKDRSDTIVTPDGKVVAVKDVAKKEFEEIFAQFIKNTKGMFNKMQKKYSNVDLEQEKKNEQIYNDALFDRGALDNRLNKLNAAKGGLTGDLSTSQGQASALIAELQGKSDATNAERQKEVEGLVTALRDTRKKLYQEAAQYVKILDDPNADEGAKNTALAKLQQVLRGLQTTKSSFAQIGHLTDKSLYDAKSHPGNVEKWTKKYLTDTPNVLGSVNRELSEKDAEKREIENKQRMAQAQLETAQKAKENLQTAKLEIGIKETYVELLEQEKNLLTEIEKKEKAKQKHTTEDKQLEDVRSKMSILRDRKIYALDAALKYNSDIALADDIRSARSQQLNRIQSKRDAINEFNFAGGAVTPELTQYKRELQRRHEEMLKAQVAAKYDGYDKNTMTEEMYKQRGADYDQARDLAKEYFDRLIVEEGKLILKNADGTTHSVVDDNVKATLISRIEDIANEEEWKKQESELGDKIEQLREQRKRAMEYGGVTWEDMQNPDIVREQVPLQNELAQLTAEKEKAQVELKELKNKGNDQVNKKEISEKNKEIKSLNDQIKEKEKQIAELDAKKVRRQDEKDAKHAEYLAAKEAKQNGASGDKTPADGKSSDDSASQSDPKITGAIKTALAGNVIDINTDGLATEETLSAILQLITNGKVVVDNRTNEDDDEIDPEMARQLAAAIESAKQQVAKQTQQTKAMQKKMDTLDGGKSATKTKELPPALQNAQKAKAQYESLKDGVISKEYKNLYMKLQNATAKAEAAIEKGLKPNSRNLENIQKTSEKMLEVGQKVQAANSEFDKLNNKVQKYKTLISDAKTNGYLLEDGDKSFVVANKNLEATIKRVKVGKASFEELGKAYRDALDAGSSTNKQINANKRLYAGTNELRAAEKQRDKIAGQYDINFDLVDTESGEESLLTDYAKAYENLTKKYNEYFEAHKLGDPAIQSELRENAAEVQKLGRKYASSMAEAEKLSEMYKNSGSFVKNGRTVNMGGFKAFSDQEMQNKVAAMKAYAVEVYGAEAASFKLNKRTMTLEGQIRENNRVVHDVAVQWNGATQGAYAYEKAERESLSGVPAFMKGLKEKTKAIAQYLFSMTSIYRVIGEVRKGIQYIREIDKALVELRKVTDETEETYDKFLQTASKTASRLGSTISAVTEATATFAKLGYSMKMASEMAEAAIVYKNVGDNIASTEDAANSIISTLKGFGLEASESMRIVDRFNEVKSCLLIQRCI